MRFKFFAPLGLAMAVLALSAPRAAAQTGSVTGLVRSAGNGAPLVAAVVQALDPGGDRVGSTLTNQSGIYLLTGLPAGTYTIAVSITGFERGDRPGIQVGAGQSVAVNFDLATRAIDLDAVVVSASRRQERAIDAPARVETVTSQEIEVRPTVTAADHLRGVPGVDIATSGVQSTNVVARGFNNVFSGAIYMLSDHRIAGVPSLRVNLIHFIPTTNEDLERIEVVLGPGAAIYGPNTANGVLHLLTRSPLTDQGTSISLAGGEQSLAHGSFRTAHLLNPNFGVKVSGQYLQANEWVYRDPVEVAEAAKLQQNIEFWRRDMMNAVGIDAAEANTRIARVGARDFDVRRWSAEVRADWRARPDLTAVFSAGTSTSDGIELTGLGAGQTVGWRSDYYQARATWGRAFAQVYLNTSDAGETFLLRNGAPITDLSKFWVAQIQHTGDLWAGRQSFTYGLDYLLTLPETEGTINGIWEDEDETTEFGGYLQSETALTPMFDLVLAGRIDTHSALPDPIFSPRAALVFKPSQDQSFRVSFNRAFSTPTSLTQFLDLGSPSPDADAARLGYSLRIQGTGDRGFALRQGEQGYLIRSPFTPPALGGSNALLPAQQARLFWPAAVQVIAAQSPLLGSQPQLVAFLSQLNPAAVHLDTQLPLSPESRTPLADLAGIDVAPIRESTSNTFEVGYKGLLRQRLLLAADIWWSRRENLVTPLTVATPLVHFNEASTQAFLIPQLTGVFMASGLTQAQAAAQAAQLAPTIAAGIARVPVAVISSTDVNATGPQLLVTYYNVDQSIDLYGTDLSARAILTDNWSMDVTVSLVDEDVFEATGGQRVTLNAPKRKGSVAATYRNVGRGLHGEARVRHNSEYPVDSGVYKATACLGDTGPAIEPCVGGYSLVDLTLGYTLPQIRGVTVQLAIQNLLDEGYRSFPGVPDIGRMAMLRLRYEM